MERNIMTNLLECTAFNEVDTNYDHKIKALWYFKNWYIGTFDWFSARTESFFSREPNEVTQVPMYRCLTETLETLIAKDRILLINQMKDYSSDNNLNPAEDHIYGWMNQNIVLSQISVKNYSDLLGHGYQLLVTFDLETLRQNEVQIFVSDHIEARANFITTVPVCNRQLCSVQLDLDELVPNYSDGSGDLVAKIILRPVRLYRELYCYRQIVNLVV